MGTSPCSKGVRDKCASAAGSTVLPFEIPFTHERRWWCIPPCQAALWSKPSTWKWGMEESKWVRKSKENALEGHWWPCQYHLAVSLPQSPQPTLQPHVKVTACPVTKPCPYCCSRGLHCQHCFIARHWAEDVQVQHHPSNTQQLSIGASLFTETL